MTEKIINNQESWTADELAAILGFKKKKIDGKIKYELEVGGVLIKVIKDIVLGREKAMRIQQGQLTPNLSTIIAANNMLHPIKKQ